MTSTASVLASPVTRHYAHTSAGGFCTVCGTVWPCATASRESVTLTLALPVAR